MAYIYLNKETNIKALPESIGELTELEKLIFHETKVNKLPKSLYKLKKLEQLTLYYCPIDEKEVERLKKELPNTEVI